MNVGLCMCMLSELLNVFVEFLVILCVKIVVSFGEVPICMVKLTC